MPQTDETGFNHATAEIAAGRAQGHALWVLLNDAHDRDGYALRPSPWEGAGEYQHVTYQDGPSVLVRLPGHRSLPTKAA